MEKTTEVRFLNSMKFKIIVTVFLGTLFVSLMMLGVIIPESREEMGNLTYQVLETLTRQTATTLENVYAMSGEELEYDTYQGLLKDAGVIGLSSSYAYLVDEHGTMLYHPNQDKVGEPVENEVVKGVVEKIAAGTIPQPECVKYDYHGVTKFASYSVLSNKAILVFTVDSDQILSGCTKMINRSILCAVGVMVIVLIFNFLTARVMVKPLLQVSRLVAEISELKFVNHAEQEKLLAKKDECGMMARAVNVMKERLRDTLLEINGVSDLIQNNVGALQNSSNEIVKSCAANNSVTQQLVASMEETASATETIDKNVGRMSEESKLVQEKIEAGKELSAMIENRAQDLKKTTEKSVEYATDVCRQVQADTKRAVEESKSVDKINDLTNVIKNISSQTSLLALNASIEAARAGEAGRGFAVVASEISTLAGQTAEAVENINTIVDEVVGAVNNMASSIQVTVSFLQEKMLPDYNAFSQISNQYSTDAKEIKASMLDIQDSIHQFNQSIGGIVVSVDDISKTITDTTENVNTIAEKTAFVAQETDDNGVLVTECMQNTDGLHNITKRFLIE